MQLAIDQASIALKNNEFPVGAVITQHNQVVAQACNTVETNRDPTQHAEVLAIRQALSNLDDKYLTDCDIYVTLEPCLMCFKALSLVKIRRIYYGLTNTFGYNCENLDYKALGFNHVPEIYGGINEAQIASLFVEALNQIRTCK